MSGLHGRNLRNRIVGPFAFEAPRGACLAISGRSGSGKSLLLRMIADLDPHEGEVWLEGLPRAAMPAHVWRRLIGYVPAQSGWWGDRVGEHFVRPAEAEALCPELLLPAALLDAPVTRLSTGERQRLALLRALEADPEMLLLDEPTSGLDEAATRAVERLLEQRRGAGLGLLLVSHDPAQIGRLAQRHLRLDAGRLEEIVR